MTKPQPQAADFIQPLYINGMNGRMMRVPAAKDGGREILLVYGHHALLERWWGLVENLNDFGAVTMPDLPGFGGMDSFYKIGRTPTVDAYADYLAAFFKMYYRRKRVTVVGISFGFVIITRMLQRYPELVKKVDLVVSMVGFMHQTDFFFTPSQRRNYSLFARFLSAPPVAFLVRYCGLNGFVIRKIYVRMPAGRRRFLEMDPTAFDSMMDFEVELWQKNDVRTHWRTTGEFLLLDNCQGQIDLPVWHVASRGDHYFNNEIVEQHMRVVFNDYHRGTMNSLAHTPSILGDKTELGIMVPAGLRKVLRQKPRGV
ncbi:MAG TPA: alpha/beta hydrolase [Candidatus Saccharimonadales bacterium]|nr:alpha/beta hydrolase [Candidatus Saccharimonadales bacterium]